MKCIRFVGESKKIVAGMCETASVWEQKMPDSPTIVLEGHSGSVALFRWIEIAKEMALYELETKVRIGNL